LPGAMAISLLPDLQRGDEVFPRLLAEYAPAGLVGLVLAALLAAIMSSVDSALNSASTLITLDFVQPRKPGLDARTLARLGRWITLGLMALAALWAPMIESFPGLFAYLQQAFAYVTPPLVAVFALAFLDRRLGARAALYATASGHVFSAAWFVATQLGWLDIHFTIVAGVLFAVTVLFAFAWRRVTGESPGPAALAVLDQAAASASPAWLRPAALAMTVATASLVLAFW
ncbi:MAG: Na+/glucose cotransporter, partial [Arenimonas sp.]|nr:Na+/glucose cotransporter [Arenimonas sp.]